MRKNCKRCGALLLILALILCAVPAMAFAEGSATGTPVSADTIPVDAVNFPDPVFRQWVLDHADTDDDGALSKRERDAVEAIGSMQEGPEKLSDATRDLAGIQYFSQLRSLVCDGTAITVLDVSGLPNLETLSCGNTAIKELDVGNLAHLEYLDCGGTIIRALDVSGLSNLQKLYCSNTPITQLDVSGLSNLTELYCRNTAIASLQVEGLVKLRVLGIDGTAITQLDASKLPALQELWCTNAPITVLDVNGLSELQDLHCGGTQIKELDLSNVPKLTRLDCSETAITELRVGDLPSLETIYCDGTGITELDLSGAKRLGALRGPALLALRLPAGVSAASIDLELSAGPVEIPMADGVTSYDLRQSAPSIEAGRMQKLSGAAWDEKTTELTELKKGQMVSYEYDCGNGYMLPVSVYFRWAGDPPAGTSGPSDAGSVRDGVEATTLQAKSSTTAKGIRVDWNKSKGYRVDYYEVFRSTKKNSGYGKTAYYKTPNGSKTYYINTKGLQKGTRYYYKVRGVRLVNGEKVYTKSTKAWRLWK